MCAKATKTIRVYQHDVDWAGVLYHANHLKYFDMARCEWWQANGFEGNIFHHEKDYAFAVVEMHIKYLKPIRLGEALTIISAPMSAGKHSVTFKQHISRGGVIMAESTATLVFVDIHSGKPSLLLGSIIRALEKSLH